MSKDLKVVRKGAVQNLKEEHSKQLIHKETASKYKGPVALRNSVENTEPRGK